MSEKLIITEISGYRDGGTISIKTNLGEYCIDNRAMSDENDNDIKNPTEGMLYFEYPSKGKQIDLIAAKTVKSKLKKALKVFMEKAYVYENQVQAINKIKTC